MRPAYWIGLGAFGLFCLYAYALLPRSGPRTQCLSNVKAMATAALVYSESHNGHLMDRDQWMDQIAPQFRATFRNWPFYCPAVREQWGNRQLYGYAFNSRLSTRSIAEFPNPGEVLMDYESINLARNASDPVTSLPSPPRRHRGFVNNIGYLDGHAKGLGVPPDK